MSLVFIVQHNGIDTPHGFTKANDGIFYRFESSRYGNVEPIATTVTGIPIFPEDYANKRLYLQRLNSEGKGWSKFSGRYRLKDETILLLKSLGANTLFCVKDFSELGNPLSDCISFSLK